ncbi:golgin subfamily A member 6-like protein 22 [Impatiens glandulifera]|uniref:golgin subfamily A member 6-like protein 22 n=1 Tax=Impatiens glandulifera TaxID=253017 RepID=UPI001FB14BD7|nr:golgin subfamily A member 6-like protein 22 [Impatiens glandulifera]
MVKEDVMNEKIGKFNEIGDVENVEDVVLKDDDVQIEDGVDKVIEMVEEDVMNGEKFEKFNEIEDVEDVEKKLNHVVDKVNEMVEKDVMNGEKIEKFNKIEDVENVNEKDVVIKYDDVQKLNDVVDKVNEKVKENVMNENDVVLKDEFNEKIEDVADKMNDKVEEDVVLKDDVEEDVVNEKITVMKYEDLEKDEDFEKIEEDNQKIEEDLVKEKVDVMVVEKKDLEKKKEDKKNVKVEKKEDKEEEEEDVFVEKNNKVEKKVDKEEEDVSVEKVDKKVEKKVDKEEEDVVEVKNTAVQYKRKRLRSKLLTPYTDPSEKKMRVKDPIKVDHLVKFDLKLLKELMSLLRKTNEFKMVGVNTCSTTYRIFNTMLRKAKWLTDEDLEAAFRHISKSTDAVEDDHANGVVCLGNSNGLHSIGSSNNISLHPTPSHGYVPIAAKGHKESGYALAMNDNGNLLMSGGIKKVPSNGWGSSCFLGCWIQKLHRLRTLRGSPWDDLRFVVGRPFFTLTGGFMHIHCLIFSGISQVSS